MRRKKAAALIGAAAVVGSLGVGGVQAATAADQTTKYVYLDDVWQMETWKVVSRKGGTIKSVETMDKYSPGDKWGAWFVDHQNRVKGGTCSKGSTTAWYKNIGTVGVPAQSPWGPGGAPVFSQLNVYLCQGDGHGAKVRISYVGDVSFYKISPQP